MQDGNRVPVFHAYQVVAVDFDVVASFLRRKNVDQNCSGQPTGLSQIIRVLLLPLRITHFAPRESARQLLTKAKYTSETVAFWWRRHGLDRGVWDSLDALDDPMDAWADIAAAIEGIAQWQSESDGTGNSLRDFRRAQSSHISELGAFEIAAIWSLLP